MPKKRKRGAGLQNYRKKFRPGNERIRIDKRRADSNLDNSVINTIIFDKEHEVFERKKKRIIILNNDNV